MLRMETAVFHSPSIQTPLNNHEIAEKMVVTPKTVRSHTSNILSKLHLQDRTQAAVYAWQQGIVRRDDPR